MRNSYRLLFRWAPWLGIPAAVLGIWALSASGLLATGSVQRSAPAVTLEISSTESLRLDAPGKVVVLNFFASWCPPCRDEAPALRTVNNRLSGRDDVVMVGVIYQDNGDDAADYLSDYDLTYAAIEDSDGRLARAFRVGGIPKTLVISPSGEIVLSHFGAIRADQLFGAIEEATAR